MILYFSEYLPVYLSVYLSIHMSIKIYTSIYLSICLSILLAIYLSIHFSACLAACLYINLSSAQCTYNYPHSIIRFDYNISIIHLSIYLSIYASIYLSARDISSWENLSTPPPRTTHRCRDSARQGERGKIKGGIRYWLKFGKSESSFLGGNCQIR